MIIYVVMEYPQYEGEGPTIEMVTTDFNKATECKNENEFVREIQHWEDGAVAAFYP